MINWLVLDSRICELKKVLFKMFDFAVRQRPCTSCSHTCLCCQAVKVEVIGDFPQQVWCKIRVDSGYDLLIGVCYRTPIEQVFGKENHSKLRDMLLEVSNKNFILMGDFNYGHIDWSIGACESGATKSVDCFYSVYRRGL